MKQTNYFSYHGGGYDVSSLPAGQAFTKTEYTLRTMTWDKRRTVPLDEKNDRKGPNELQNTAERLRI